MAMPTVPYEDCDDGSVASTTIAGSVSLKVLAVATMEAFIAAAFFVETYSRGARP